MRVVSGVFSFNAIYLGLYLNKKSMSFHSEAQSGIGSLTGCTLDVGGAVFVFGGVTGVCLTFG
jgi:hypothetical protein